MIACVLVFVAIWIYVLYTMKRCSMGVWYFILGSVGLFVFLMILVEPHVVDPLERMVTTVTGYFGAVTGVFDSYFDCGILFIQHGNQSLSLYVDFECSGIIEIMAYISLLWFFWVYKTYEKIFLSVIGVVTIFFSNVIRIYVICFMIRSLGSDWYFTAHTIVGRIIFYVLTVLLYYYVFTKGQIDRQKVGGFSYERA